MAGHRNRLEEQPDRKQRHAKDDAAGIRVRGETRDLIFKNNIIRDTRPASDRKANHRHPVGGKSGRGNA